MRRHGSGGAYRAGARDRPPPHPRALPRPRPRPRSPGAARPAPIGARRASRRPGSARRRARLCPDRPRGPSWSSVHDEALVAMIASDRRVRAAGWLDADTAMNERVLRRRAAGRRRRARPRSSASTPGEADGAFCAVRPPGHHATPTRSMGFCLFNNVAVTAAALAARGERVLIVDYDAHHGNGTQDIFWTRRAASPTSRSTSTRSTRAPGGSARWAAAAGRGHHDQPPAARRAPPATSSAPGSTRCSRPSRRRSTRRGCSSRPASTPTAPIRSPTSACPPATTPTSPPRCWRWRPRAGGSCSSRAATTSTRWPRRRPRAWPPCSASASCPSPPPAAGPGRDAVAAAALVQGRARRLRLKFGAPACRCRPDDPVGRAPDVPARGPGFRPAPEARDGAPRARRRAAASGPLRGPGRPGSSRRWPRASSTAPARTSSPPPARPAPGFSVAGLGRFRVAIHRQRGLARHGRAPGPAGDPRPRRARAAPAGGALRRGGEGAGAGDRPARVRQDDDRRRAHRPDQPPSAPATSSPSRTRSRCSTPTPRRS